MKGFISTILLVFLGFYVTVYLVFFGMEYFKRDSVILTMIESAKIASITSLDASARVTPEKAKITEDTFQNTFETMFNKNLNVKMNIQNISYEFLKDNDDNIKAVQVIVTDENGTEYQTTLKEHIPE